MRPAATGRVVFAWHVVCVIGSGVHLFVSLAAHGWHPAAWRVSGQAGFAGAAPFLRAARTAEEGGLDAVLLGLPTASRAARASARVDGLHFDPLPLLGLLIGATERIGLCGYWPVDVAEPFHVARVFATLDHLSGGRTGWIAGLAGRAETEGRFQRADLPYEGPDALARQVELIDVARRLWDSWEDRSFVVDQATGTFADSDHVHPIDHADRFFTVRGPLNVPRPVQGQPVILQRDVLASARSGIAASAEVVLAAPAALAEAKAARAEWRALAPDVRYVASLVVVLGETEAIATKRAAELDALADDRRPRFVGTPEQLAAHLAQWQAAGACHGFDILPAVLSIDLDLLVTGVVPLLRARGLRPKGYAGGTLRDHLQLARPLSRFAA
jgi:alkanesulfonate monooxygenase SsuD/methylene tetrahydromethanopterin reductase-like flavin-dependent oxidoreductase (luciferase family)